MGPSVAYFSDHILIRMKLIVGERLRKYLELCYDRTFIDLILGEFRGSVGSEVVISDLFFARNRAR